jgi:phage-related protein
MNLVWDIEFFETENGNSPVEKYLESLENERMENTIYQIKRLAQRGPENMPPKMIGFVKGIKYLRIKDRKGIIRIFFTVEKGKLLLLLHAFSKKEQKLKNSDINLALSRQRKWRKSHG